MHSVNSAWTSIVFLSRFPGMFAFLGSRSCLHTRAPRVPVRVRRLRSVPVSESPVQVLEQPDLWKRGGSYDKRRRSDTQGLVFFNPHLFRHSCKRCSGHVPIALPLSSNNTQPSTKTARPHGRVAGTLLLNDGFVESTPFFRIESGGGVLGVLCRR